jgi:ATP-dependent DNA helicase RecQ
VINKATSILNKVFGYHEFKPLQKEIVANVLEKKDTLVIMPTGGGKSLCYQLPALIFSGLTVVVSPLISLMKDQVQQLTALGVKAVCLNSSLDHEEYQSNADLVRNGTAKLLYVAPETLLMPKTLDLLDQCNVESLTIDEAHCISEWGHDFRPDYRKLINLKRRFPNAVCIALTATATLRVREDIKKNLNIESSNAFIASFNRDNLFLEIVNKSDPVPQTIEFLKKFPDQSGIIYCLSRKQVDELSGTLAKEGFSVRPYHAGLGEDIRNENQDSFIRDDVQIIVATVAFGMGINKPNVRFVVHYDLPKNIEHYYQEIGRAGRDGLPAHCLMLFSYSDIQKIKFFISQMTNEQEQLVATLHLTELLGMVETDMCRRIPLLKYFGEVFAADTCDICDNCVNEKPPLVDITVPAQKFLSCIKRTDETFGISHITDVLRGSEAQKILKFRHHLLSTHAIGKEYSKKQWSHLARQFIQKGLIFQDLEHGSLKLTPKAWDVMLGRDTVMGLIDDSVVPRSKSKRRLETIDYDHKLFELLRTQRKTMADADDVPAFVIFPDKTLMEMAHSYPKTRSDLLLLHGVGEKKAQKFGETFLAIIKAYRTE